MFNNTVSLLTESMLELKSRLSAIEHGEVSFTTQEVVDLNLLLTEYENAKIVLNNFNK